MDGVGRRQTKRVCLATPFASRILESAPVLQGFLVAARRLPKQRRGTKRCKRDPTAFVEGMRPLIGAASVSIWE